MHEVRQQAIQVASKAKKFGIIMGTLGRQGSPKVFDVSIDILACNTVICTFKH